MTSNAARARSAARNGGNRSQSDVGFDGITHMISAGQLQPGGRLPVEQELSEQLGVSRGSLREGVRALALMGVLETRQGAGTYVTSLDPATLLAPLGVLVDLQRPENIIDLMSVRRVLEVEAAGRAALRISDAELAAAGNVLMRMERMLDHDPVDHEALEAFKLCARLEGILPALEPAHALAHVIRTAPQMEKDKIIVMNMCGRGDKDIFTVADALKVTL